MTDLTTRYLGLALRSPIVASASPLTGEPDSRPVTRLLVRGLDTDWNEPPFRASSPSVVVDW
jgi:hypothetical protein